jgi:hypothetical protein
MNARVMALTAAALLLSAGCEKVEIRRQLAPGQYLSTIDTKMHQTITPEGAPDEAMEQRMDQQMTMRMDAGEPDAEGRQTLRISFDSFKQTVHAGGQTMTYDSDSSEDAPPGPIARQLAPLLDVNIEVTVGPDGQALFARGLDAMWDRMAETNPEAAPMFQEMKKSLGDDTVRQMVKSQQGMNPPAAVAVGDAWKPEAMMNLPVIGQTRVMYDCTVVRIAEEPCGKVVHVAISGSIRQAEDEEPVEGPGGIHIRDLDMTQAGTFELIADTGLTRRTSIDQHATFELSAPGRGGERRRMSAVQDTDIHVRTVPVEEAAGAASGE